MSFPQPCLPVSKRFKKNETVDFENLDSAADYLARVSQQARNLPEVFQSKPQRTALSKPHAKSIEGSAACLEYLLHRTHLQPAPSVEHLPHNLDRWTTDTIETFSRLRDYLDDCSAQGIGGKLHNRLNVPAMKDRAGWHVFCVGSDEANGNVQDYYGEDYDKQEDEEAQQEIPPWKHNLPPPGYAPEVSLLLQMDQVLVRTVLRHLVFHLDFNAWTLSESRATWIYALLARLERPLHRNDASLLRGMLQTLCRLRARLTADDEQLPRLNVLVVIVGLYFEQGGGIENIMRVREQE